MHSRSEKTLAARLVEQDSSWFLLHLYWMGDRRNQVRLKMYSHAGDNFWRSAVAPNLIIAEYGKNEGDIPAGLQETLTVVQSSGNGNFDQKGRKLLDFFRPWLSQRNGQVTGDIAGPERGQPAHASAFKALQLPNHGLLFTLRLSVLKEEPAGLLP